MRRAGKRATQCGAHAPGGLKVAEHKPEHVTVGVGVE
jgi:hypothetical protein